MAARPAALRRGLKITCSGPPGKAWIKINMPTDNKASNRRAWSKRLIIYRPIFTSDKHSVKDRMVKWLLTRYPSAKNEGYRTRGYFTTLLKLTRTVGTPPVPDADGFGRPLGSWQIILRGVFDHRDIG